MTKWLQIIGVGSPIIDRLARIEDEFLASAGAAARAARNWSIRRAWKLYWA